MVEWKKLGEIGEICMCKRIMKDQTSDNGDIPFYKIGTFGKKADAYISRNLFENYKTNFSYPKKGEILISAAGTIGRSVVFDGEDAYYQDSNIVWIANDEKTVTNRFLFYFYQIAEWKTDGGTIKRLYNYNLKNTKIPVPSLEEQKRVVGILDTFTDSIENLKQQIAQRRKQFEFYRDCIFKHVDSKETTWKKLSEIAVIFKGPYITKKGSKEGNVPVVMGGQKAAYYIDNNNSEGESIVISRSGINAGFVSFWNQPIFVSDGYRIDNKDIIVKKFLFHFLKSIEGIINSSKKGAGVPHVQSNYLLNILIPLPPLSEQQRIVSILDTFEASISNLEAQLAQRQKQYEYYRNQLLTFE